MLSKDGLRNILIGITALLFFTLGLLVFHNSKLEKGEYDRICHSIYDEKVWIDTCYLPYEQEANTLEMALKIEAAGIIISLLVLLYFHPDKHLRKVLSRFKLN